MVKTILVHQHTDPNSHQHTDRHHNEHTDKHRDEFLQPNADRSSDADAVGDFNTDCDANARGSHQHPHSDRDGHADLHGLKHADDYRHEFPQGNADRNWPSGRTTARVRSESFPQSAATMRASIAPAVPFCCGLP